MKLLLFLLIIINKIIYNNIKLNMSFLIYLYFENIFLTKNEN